MIDALSNTPVASIGDIAKHRKLVDAAQQFEAIFLNQMLKSAKFFGDDENGEGSTVAGMGTEAMSKAIAAAGGFGIAHHIVAQVEAEHSRQMGAKEISPEGLKETSAAPIHSL